MESLMTSNEITSFRFSTKNLPPRQRLLRWNETFGRPVARRVLAPPWSSDGQFHVEMAGYTLGSANISDNSQGISVMRMTVTAGGEAHRTRELLSDGNDDVILHVHEVGQRVVSQLGREATVEPGAGLLSSNADTSRMVLPGPARFSSVAVPRKLLTARAPGVEDAFLRPLPPDASVLRLLVRYLDILEDERALSTPELQHAVATHIQDLCALAVGATRDAAEIAKGRSLRAARLRMLKAHIAENLGDGDLSAATLARCQGVTPRYIHKLFETEGTTLSKFVRGQRLAEVHRRLADPRHAGLTIGAIAYSAGFGDLSTFNRAFRQHFGVRPSEVRRESSREAYLVPDRLAR
ncbi:helix-turn-helix domain-containing protein [Mesorhizobium sp. M0496]|uniref:helix-turn-helix domain-containing protein n=2 Tax=unclassified Mesorhizobium TaxID=325217 RepID=UPI00333CF3C3